MHITVIGSSRTGSVVDCCLTRSGHTVTGNEINSEKLAVIQTDGSPFYKPGSGELFKPLEAIRRLQFSQKLPESQTPRVFTVAANASSLPEGSTDLSLVQNAFSEAFAIMTDTSTIM